jgi:hypothetical protein
VGGIPLSHIFTEVEMSPPPVILGLLLCKYVHFEEGAPRNASLIGCFSKLRVKSFPATPPFYLYALLTNAVGDVTMKVTIEGLDTGDELYAREVTGRFLDKLGVHQLSFPIRQCTFPGEGWYQITLFANGDWLAQRRFKVARS